MSIFITDDGSHSILSEQFGVSYHSKHGAIQETQHVFIDAGLHHFIKNGKTDVTILEIGFGTGLNALMTFIEAEKLGMKIRFITYEKYPITQQQFQSLNYCALLKADESTSKAFSTMHSSEWGREVPLSNNFIFIKNKEDFADINLENEIDIIYFDAFAPQAQPHLWESELMLKMYESLKKEGILTTYCAQGQFRRTLKEVGFKVEKIPGPPFKREMTRAIKT